MYIDFIIKHETEEIEDNE